MPVLVSVRDMIDTCRSWNYFTSSRKTLL